MARRQDNDWTTGEIGLLVNHAHEGAHVVARALGRTLSSVYSKAYVLRGQGIEVDFKRKIQIQAKELRNSEIAIIRRNAPEILCPSCGHRFAAIRSTGLCLVCHEAELKLSHEAEYDRLNAKRTTGYIEGHQGYNAAKKRVERKRKELGIVPMNSRRRRKKD